MALVTLSGYPASGKSRRATEIKDYLEKKLTSSNHEGLKFSVSIISDDILSIGRSVYDDSRSEKPARGAIFTALTRDLNKNTIIIMDGMNYIKGFRYQMYCAAREAQVRTCTVFIAATPEDCRKWNANKQPNEQYASPTLENLIMRYEEPNSMARWDSPLFTVSTEDDLPAESIFAAVISGAKAPTNVAVLQVTNAKPPMDALQILETTSATVVNLISNSPSMTSGSGGVVPIILPPTTRTEISLPSRNISLAELQRHKRQFISAHKKAISQGTKGSVEWSPVVVHPSKSHEVVNQGHPGKQAVLVKLTPESVRALKDATVKARQLSKSTGKTVNPLQILLSGNTPGFTIAKQQFPISLQPNQPNANGLTELFIRHRVQNPTKPSHHRPPLSYCAPIVAKASVSRVLNDEATQRVRDRSAQAEQQRKERHVQIIDTPLAMGKKSGAAGSNKKRKSVGASTASSLARNVLQKGVTVKARNEGSSSTPPSTTPSGTTTTVKQHRHSPSLSNGNNSPNSLDTTSLRAQVIHQLAYKPSTSKDLRSLSNKATETENLSDVLRSVALAEDSPITKPVQSHWSKSFASPSQHSGPWYLQREVYASSVHPFTWPLYDDADRQRIADDTFAAMDELELADDVPERRRLVAEKSAWLKKKKMEGNVDRTNGPERSSVASGSKATTPAVPPVARKVKMNKMSEPRMSGGSTLSAPTFRGGMVKTTSSTSTAGSTKDKKSPLHMSMSGDQPPDRDMEQAGRSTPSETRKRPSPPSNLLSSTSGHATPLPNTSKPNLAHPLPPRPQTSLAPPSSSSTIRQSSRTPPTAPATNVAGPSSILPSRTSTPIPSPRHAPSASVSSASASSKRKRDGDDASVSSHVSTSAHDAKKLKIERQLPVGPATSKEPLSNGASSIPKKPGTAKASSRSSKAPDSRASQASPSQQSQSLKAPTQQTNGKSPPGRAAAITAATKPERHSSPLPRFTKKDASPAPPAYNKVSSKEKDLPPIPSHSRKRTDHVPEKKGSRRRHDIDYTDTSASASEVEEAPPPIAVKPARPNAVPSSQPPSSRTLRQDSAPSRSNRPVPLDLPMSDRSTPLPQDEEALRELFSVRYAESSEILARLAREKVKLQRALRGNSPDEGMLDHASIEALSLGYHELQEELEAIKAALEQS
ncbi:hypothetical protein FRB98_009222 [Tulasnella sp. 332]|nr:hypothetical protein FRB98_009222 [Tulasnella sp. 332]